MLPIWVKKEMKLYAMYCLMPPLCSVVLPWFQGSLVLISPISCLFVLLTMILAKLQSICYKKHLILFSPCGILK